MLIASRVIDKHSELSGLSSDDHSQYLHTTVQRTVTACHEFRSNGFGVPIVIKRILGQTANLLNIYDDSYALLSYIDKDGNIFGTSFTGNVAGSNITGSISSSVLPSNIAYKDSSNSFTVGDQQITIDANTKKGLTIKAAVLQGVNLLNIINSNSDPLFTVGAGGETLIRSSTLSNVFTIRNSLNTTYIRFDNTNDDTTPRGRLTLNSGSTNKLLLYTDGTDNFIRSDGDLKFNFNGNQRFIFDQSGNLTASGVYYGSGAGLTNIQLSQLSDVLINTPASGQVIKYNSATSKWENGTDNALTTHYHSGSDITSGTVGTVYGGTGLSSYAIGDFIYASGVNALTTLSGNTTATQKVLRMVSGTPSWIDFTLSNLNDATVLNNYALLASSNTFTAQNTFAAGTITASAPTTITQTWNNAGVTFNGLLVNVTDTASASASLLCDLQVGGTSKCKVDKAGTITVASSVIAGGVVTAGTQLRCTNGVNTNSTTALKIQSVSHGGTSSVTQAYIGGYANSASAATHTALELSPTYNQTGTAGSTDLKIVRTETALGSGTHRLIDCYSGAAGTTNVFYVTNGGAFSATGWSSIANGGLSISAGYGIAPIQNNATLFFHNGTISQVVGKTAVELATGTHSPSSGTSVAVNIRPTYNQTSTAGSTDLKIVRTETAIGSGNHRFIDCYGGPSGTNNIFSVSNSGVITSTSSLTGDRLIISNSTGTSSCGISNANTDGTPVWRLFGPGSNYLNIYDNSMWRFGTDLSFNYGASNYQLAKFSNSEILFENKTVSTGATKLVVRAGVGQSTTNLQEWQNSGTSGVLAYINPNGHGYFTGNVASTSNFYWNSHSIVAAGKTQTTMLAYGQNIVSFSDASDVNGRGIRASNLYLQNTVATINTTKAKLGIDIGATDERGLFITAASGQIANLQEWKNNNGTVLASISPSGTLLTKGIITNLVAATGNYTLTNIDSIVTASGTITLTLPTAIGVTGQTYTIKKIDAGSTLTINTTSSQTIDGVTSLTTLAQYTSTTVVSDGANWLLI